MNTKPSFDLGKLCDELYLKHGCVRAACQAVKSGEYQAGNQAHTISADIALVGGVVELGTNIDEAIGFEPESVWPVIAMLWDIHGYKGVYDMGVVGVWMSGLGCMVYVCSISAMGAAQ